MTLFNYPNPWIIQVLDYLSIRDWIVLYQCKTELPITFSQYVGKMTHQQRFMFFNFLPGEDMIQLFQYGLLKLSSPSDFDLILQWISDLFINVTTIQKLVDAILASDESDEQVSRLLCASKSRFLYLHTFDPGLPRVRTILHANGDAMLNLVRKSFEHKFMYADDIVSFIRVYQEDMALIDGLYYDVRLWRTIRALVNTLVCHNCPRVLEFCLQVVNRSGMTTYRLDDIWRGIEFSYSQAFLKTISDPDLLECLFRNGLTLPTLLQDRFWLLKEWIMMGAWIPLWIVIKDVARRALVKELYMVHRLHTFLPEPLEEPMQQLVELITSGSATQ